MSEPRKILLLFAHPSQHRSEVNIHLLNAARTMANVTAVDLYHEYPTHQINIAREQQRLLDHDIIIFQFPLYWYSTPAILKDWQDLVLEYGFAYGEGGDKLKGKTFLCSTTAGAGLHSYSSEGHNHYSIRDLLLPLEQTARLCGMHYVPPFVLFGIRAAIEEGRVDKHIERWKNLLRSLSRQTFDLGKIAQCTHLCERLDQVIEETL